MGKQIIKNRLGNFVDKIKKEFFEPCLYSMRHSVIRNVNRLKINLNNHHNKCKYFNL